MFSSIGDRVGTAEQPDGWTCRRANSQGVSNTQFMEYCHIVWCLVKALTHFEILISHLKALYLVIYQHCQVNLDCEAPQLEAPVVFPSTPFVDFEFLNPTVFLFHYFRRTLSTLEYLLVVFDMLLTQTIIHLSIECRVLRKACYSRQATSLREEIA